MISSYIDTYTNKKNKFFWLIPALAITAAYSEPFLHPSDVVREMQKKFKDTKSYQAKFTIDIQENKKNRSSSGVASFQRGGKLNFTFNQPAGDTIISDGKKLWVYVARLRAVGMQDLNTTGKDGKNIYDTASYEGLVRLFQRYHYRFDDSAQPRQIEGGNYYVLELKEKVSSGGYEKMILYVNPQTYLIERITAFSPSGRQVKLRFSSIELNTDLPASLFQFKGSENIRVVENPLTTDG